MLQNTAGEEIFRSDRICIISFPISASFSVPLSNLIKILTRVYNKVDVIIAAYENVPQVNYVQVKYYCVNHKSSRNTIIKAIRFISLQIIITFLLLIKSRKSKTVIFFMEIGPYMPLIISRLIGKNTIWILPSSFLKMSGIGRSFPKLLTICHPINYLLAEKIVVYSPNIVREWCLEKYNNKVLIGSEHFIDTDHFNIARSIDQRNNTIGYIGRLSEEKGIINFINASDALLKKWTDYNIIIIGDGPLKNEVHELIIRLGLNEKIKCTGWISRDSLPDYLNNIKFLVVPSFTEGLPNTIIEAMSCGTIVIASPVGAIPDIISNGNNGFIMKNNSVAEILSAIDLALRTADINQMSIKSREYIINNYNFDSTVKRFRTILKTRGESEL